MSNPEDFDWHVAAADGAVKAILSFAKKRDMQGILPSDVAGITACMLERMTVGNFEMIAEIGMAIHNAAMEQLNGPDNAS